MKTPTKTHACPVEFKRIQPQDAHTNPLQGEVVWSPIQSLWFTAHALIAAVGGWFIRLLSFCGLAWDSQTPEQHAHRPERHELPQAPRTRHPRATTFFTL